MARIRSVKETAEALRVAVGTLHNWRTKGCGPKFVRIGHGRGRIGYRDEDIEAFINAGLRRSTSETEAAA